jgi:hypothetical protein
MPDSMSASVHDVNMKFAAERSEFGIRAGLAPQGANLQKAVLTATK